MHPRNRIQIVLLLCSSLVLSPAAFAQSINSGTVTGTVTDPSGGVVPGAAVEISNAITGYRQTTVTDPDGFFRFNNVPFNNYRLTATHVGFNAVAQDVAIRSTVPLTVTLALPLAGVITAVTVEGGAATSVENVPNAHTDLDISALFKLPITTPGAGLSEVIAMAAPGVVADSNGFFHPLGDHSETSFQIDGQPVNDQLSKVFSTQLPTNAIQSLELITGFPSAEYGEKTSLVVNATTRSGLGSGKAHGSFVTEYGSFGTVGEAADIGFGTQRFGYFLALNGSRSRRFLDTPEFLPLHAIGNNASAFNRLDFQPITKNAFHLNLFFARNWFQIPNTFDPPGQAQPEGRVPVHANSAGGALWPRRHRPDV